MASRSDRSESVNPRAAPPVASTRREGKSIDGTTGVPDATIRSTHSSSIPSPWSITSMPRSRAIRIASRLAMWPRTLPPRRWAASIPAASSSRVISMRSAGPTVPWPPVTNILMISAPSLISSRTDRRNSAGPSLRRIAPRAPICQCGGKLLSPACPVVLTSRLQGTSRGPSTRPSAMATFIDASIAKGAPALTALVKPDGEQSLEAGRRADRLEGHRLLEPEGCGDRPELVVGRVEVAVDHARHDRAAFEVDHPVVGAWVGDRTGTHRGDPVAFDDQMGAGRHRVVAVEDTWRRSGRAGSRFEHHLDRTALAVRGDPERLGRVVEREAVGDQHRGRSGGALEKARSRGRTPRSPWW